MIILSKIRDIKDMFISLSLWKKLIILISITCIVWFGISKLQKTKSSQPVYQTAAVEKGTLIVSVSASGNVTSINNSPITTNATGVVKNVFVKDGDLVKAGDKIAEIDLDIKGKETNSSAYSSYQSAKNSAESAKASLYSSQSDMLAKWKLYKETAENNTYSNSDGSPNTLNRTLPQFMITADDWLASEAKYKVQEAIILQTQTAMNALNE